MMWSMTHHYLTKFAVQTRGQVSVCLFRRIGFQVQFGAYGRCGRFQRAAYTEVVPHEPVCVHNKLFHAQNRLFQFRFCRVQMCFQPAVLVRVQVDCR